MTALWISNLLTWAVIGAWFGVWLHDRRSGR